MLSIVVLNCNGIKYLEPCFESILKQTDSEFKTILVDNGSTDGSIDFVKKNYPWVDILLLRWPAPIIA